MSDGSTIEWLARPGTKRATWNPVVGCTHASAGCAYCYAERMAHRLACMARADRRAGRNPGRKAKYEAVVKPIGGWNGKVGLDLVELRRPLRWTQPRTVFVNSMGDLFYREVADAARRSVWEVMVSWQCCQHTLIVLTKRPERMRQFLYARPVPWNVWLGVTAENQRLLDERAAILRGIPADVRFVSLEPLLTRIGRIPKWLDWVIVGPETGPGRRPCAPEWEMRIVELCGAAGIPVFVKAVEIDGRISHEPSEWPKELRRREWPR